MSKITMNESVLRNTYNKIYARRNPGSGKFYDVYLKGKFKHVAKAYFTKLAERLMFEKISPRVYLEIMCGYGKWRHLRWLPPPSYLATYKAIETFQWLIERETEKHDGSLKQARKTMAGGIEIKEEEILQAVKESRKFIEGKPEAVLFALRDSISIWYFAARMLFDEEFKWKRVYSMFEKTRKSHIKQCLQFFKQNPKIGLRARKVLRCQ